MQGFKKYRAIHPADEKTSEVNSSGVFIYEWLSIAAIFFFIRLLPSSCHSPPNPIQ
jgi:hypothetical protein